MILSSMIETDVSKDDLNVAALRYDLQIKLTISQSSNLTENHVDENEIEAPYSIVCIREELV